MAKAELNFGELGASVNEIDITYEVAVASSTYRVANAAFPVAVFGFKKAKLIATGFEYSNNIHYIDATGTEISTENFSGVGDEKTFPSGTASVQLYGGANSSNATNPVNATVRLSK